MPYETDLPCSDCGGPLRERDVTPGDLSIAVETAATVVVAECRRCGARHYPDGTLKRLFESSGPSAAAGGR